MQNPELSAPAHGPTEEVQRALEAQAARHQAEVRALNERHTAMLIHLRSSLSYRIGDMIVGLRTASGRRKLPSRLRSIVQEVRQNRRPSSTIGSDWAHIEPRDARRVVSILDEFSHACFAPEARLDPLQKRAATRQVGGATFLLAETAWRGNEGQWSYAFSKYETNGELSKVFDDARRKGVPTALWNKEDPVNYETFLAVARSAEYVFTTDRDSVERYRTDLGHDRIAAVTFAAQPRIHNPIGRPADVPRTACFAGAWRGHKYPARAEGLTTLLDAAASVADLVIYDRLPERQAPGEAFPSRYANYIAGSLSYREMVAAYHRHACFLNVNSVTESPTMLSRRVFELLACRTPVVSTPSLAIDETLPNVVLTPRGFGDTAETIERLVNDVDYRDRVGQLGYRAVMTRHTYQHRLHEMTQFMSIPGYDLPNEPTIDVICVSRRPDRLQQALANIRAQLYSRARLVFVTNSSEFDRALVDAAVGEFQNSMVMHLDEELTLGECLNAAIDRCDGEYFAKFDDDDLYGAEYLSDMVLATRFTDASILGKKTFHAHIAATDQTVVRHEGHEFKYTNLVMGGTLLVKRADVRGIRFQAVPSGTDTLFLKDSASAGLSIFSTDRFNYLMLRRGPEGGHTWAISDQDFASSSRVVGRGQLTDLVMI